MFGCAEKGSPAGDPVPRGRVLFPLLGAEHCPHFGDTCRPIPKGLNHIAQGWTAASQSRGGLTLGRRATIICNPERRCIRSLLN